MVKIYSTKSIQVKKTEYEGHEGTFIYVKGEFDVAEIILKDHQVIELIEKIHLLGSKEDVT